MAELSVDGAPNVWNAKLGERRDVAARAEGNTARLNTGVADRGHGPAPSA